MKTKKIISETPSKFPALVSFLIHYENLHHEGFPQVIHCAEQWEEEKRKTLYGEPIVGYVVWNCQTLKTYDALKEVPVNYPCRVSFWDNGAGDGGWPGVVVGSAEEFQKELCVAYNFSWSCSGCSWETGYTILPLAPTGSARKPMKIKINRNGNPPDFPATIRFVDDLSTDGNVEAESCFSDVFHISNIQEFERAGRSGLMATRWGWVSGDVVVPSAPILLHKENGEYWLLAPVGANKSEGAPSLPDVIQALIIEVAPHIGTEAAQRLSDMLRAAQ
jgi:hypothetical protein